MRIFDEDNNRTLRRVTLLLKADEARELLDGLRELLERSDGHVHTSDATFEHEITVALYEEGKTDGFHERIKQVLAEDM